MNILHKTSGGICFVISLVLSFAVTISNFNVTAMAAEPAKADVKTELDNTAKAMLDYMKDAVKDTDNSYYYNHYKNYALISKAGISDKAVEKALLDYLRDRTNPDGTTKITGTPCDEIWYSYIVTFLNEIGENASDFNGINYNSLLEGYYLNAANTINPYAEQYVVAAVEFSRKAFSKPDDILAKASGSILALYKSNADGTGIDYWGISADNNGQCLSVLNTQYTVNADIKSKVDAALAWITTQLSPNNAVVYYGTESVNSTASALKGFSEFGDSDNAAKLYSGLIALRTSPIAGVYPGYDADFAPTDADYTSATPDALLGLLAYYRALDGKTTLETVHKLPDKAPVISDGNGSSEPDASKPETSEKSPASGDNAPVIILGCTLLIAGLGYSLTALLKKHYENI